MGGAAGGGEDSAAAPFAVGLPLVPVGGERPLVVAVVVTYEAAPTLHRCVASLRASRDVRLRIVVVDNASGQETRAALEREYAGAPDVDLLLLPENRHFAGGVNAGATRGLALGAALLVILNDDTEVEGDCISLLVATALDFPDAGIVGPALYDLSAPGRALSLGERYAPWSLAWPRTLLRVRSAGDGRPYRVPGVMGSALMVTRECFLRVGPYREDLLVYYEEVDFCLRARRIGFRPILVPRAIVRHDGMRGFASGLTPYAARLKCRNQIVLMRSHGGILAWMAFLPAFLGLVVASAALYGLRGEWAVVRAVVRGVLEGIAGLRRADSAGGHGQAEGVWGGSG